MRLFSVLALSLSFIASGYAQAAPAAAEAKAINTVCPISGKEVDGTTNVTLKDTAGKDVIVATCCGGCAKKAEKKSEATITAAKANKKAE
ncbi:MAG: hypothetical protein H0W72_03220 [Planctomycetes bacterium]|nr:hypothetical protein [Planctomycetota bacterium]